jgi:putative N6-adenine-specific DNA methylase
VTTRRKDISPRHTGKPTSKKPTSKQPTSKPAPKVRKTQPASTAQNPGPNSVRKPAAMPAPPSRLDCFAVVAPGLEPLALAEAQRLGLPARLEEGGFAWSGDMRSVLVANVGLRIASRVLVRLAEFEARTFVELERFAKRIPWAHVVEAGSSARFRVTCRKSRLYHSDAVAQRLAEGLRRAVSGVRTEADSAGDDELLDRGESALFIVRFNHDRCTVSADASGALLHRRGYRQATAKAPLRETLAAALVAASGWDGVAPLVDPMCGSGTIPIEAALAARRIPAGVRRPFAAERWPGVSADLVQAVRSELGAGALDAAPGEIVGSDRDAGAIESARGNADRAEVSPDVTLDVHTISAMPVPDAVRGWIVSNPPYGVRVGDAGRVRDLWAQLGNVLRRRAPGWHVTLLSPDAALERQLQIPVRVVARTTNGGIPVRIVSGQVPLLAAER